MALIDIIGVVAATMTLSGFVPQIMKAYRTKSMEDVSYFFLLFFIAGFSLWLVYGFYKNDWVIMTANAAGIFFDSVLLVMKYKYRRKK